MPPAELRIEHLSNSSIALYAECGRAWKGKYLEGLASPTTPPLLIGSVFDKTVESYLRDRARGQQPANLLTLWSTNWKERTTGDEAALIDWQGELPESVENAGAKLASFKGTAELLARLPVLVDDARPALQRRIELRVPGVPIPVIGFLDIVTADGVPGDFKTSARAWPDGKARHDIQPRLYLAALLQAGYRPPDGQLRFRHWVWTKTKEVRIQEIETVFTAAEVMVAVELVGHAWRGISAGVFVPNPRSWLCTNACAAWRSCMGRR